MISIYPAPQKLGPEDKKTWSRYEYMTHPEFGPSNIKPMEESRGQTSAIVHHQPKTLDVLGFLA
jgi:hypothetical protein